MELFFFYSLYDLFFGIILFFSLKENRKPAFASCCDFVRFNKQVGKDYNDSLRMLLNTVKSIAGSN